MRRPNLYSITQLILVLCMSGAGSSGVYDFLKCQLCETKKLDGQITDCNCEYETVDDAVANFFIPLLQNITERPFFRYFRIDLDKPCPFWDTDGGMCTNEGCSICPCEEDEIPKAWLEEQQKIIGSGGEGRSDDDEYGWISLAGDHGKEGGKANSGRLGKVSPESTSSISEAAYGPTESWRQEVTPAQQWADRWEWTEMSEETAYSNTSVYVNLVKNPEKFTGYSGPSARLVWRAIQEENCFGGGDTDTCLEKRTFYRLISGLQSSISTQIARDYYYPPDEYDYSGSGRWGPNIPMFIKAVGAHPQRLSNLYFAFLFVARAVAKASDVLIQYDYSIGDDMEKTVVENLIKQLVALPSLKETSMTSDSPHPGGARTVWKSSGVDDLQGWGNSQLPYQALEAAAQCRTGFDESALFQASNKYSSDGMYWKEVNPLDLREEFRQRFRNISRIMDCVTCEKCRVWGKLEILGLGTAIKILLTPEEEFGKVPLKEFLSRQEVIALINTLHQLAKSIHFASIATELELGEKISDFQSKVVQYTTVPLLGAGVVAMISCVKNRPKVYSSSRP